MKEYATTQYSPLKPVVSNKLTGAGAGKTLFGFSVNYSTHELRYSKAGSYTSVISSFQISPLSHLIDLTLD